MKRRDLLKAMIAAPVMAPVAAQAAKPIKTTIGLRNFIAINEYCTGPTLISEISVAEKFLRIKQDMHKQFLFGKEVPCRATKQRTASRTGIKT